MDNIQNQAFELGKQNILEEFYELIEKHRIDSTNDFKLGDFYDFLSEFDSSYQEFNTKREGDDATIYIHKHLKHSLYLFLVLFKFRGFSDRPLFYAFKRFLHWFNLVLSNNQELNSEFFFSKNISVNFPSLISGEYVDLLNKGLINFNLINFNKPSSFEVYYELFEKAEWQISKDFGLLPDLESNTMTIKDKLFVFGDDFSVSEFIVNSKDEVFRKEKTYGHLEKERFEIFF